MNNYEHNFDWKTKQTIPKETSAFPFMRNPNNFYRRPPFLPIRRRMAPRQYPNMGFRFRMFPPPLYRPNHHARGVYPYFRHPSMINSAVRIPPPIVQRPPLSPAIFSSLENKDVQCPSSQTQVTSSFTNIYTSNNSLGQHTSSNSLGQHTSSNSLGQHTSSNSLGQHTSSNSMRQQEQSYSMNACTDLWIEALAPGGRIYYYNAKTRESTWVKPTNVRIVELEENHRLNFSQFEYPQNVYQETPFLQQQHSNPFQNFYHGFPAPSGSMMFQPAQSIYNPSQVYLAHNAASTQNNLDYNFHTMTFPYAFPSTNTTRDSIPNNEFINEAEETNIILKQFEKHPNLDSKASTNNESKILDWSISGTSCSSINESDDSENTEQNPDRLSHFVFESKQHQNTIIENSVKPVQNTGDEDEKEVDKSRPVCSTPIAGTSWHVVWTGDEKVFFFDSIRKKSFWDRPEELMNREEVDKLIEKLPFSSADLKQMMKEVRKTTSEGSDVVKKLKTENRKQNKCSDLRNNYEVKKDEDKNDMKENDRTKLNEIPRNERQKIFCEKLADNEVSEFSALENEIHKNVSNARYAKSYKEQKQVFELCTHEKLEENISQHKEYTYKENIFISLLKEARISLDSKFCDIVNQCSNDERFKVIEDSKHRENIFNQYVSDLVKKKKDDDRLNVNQRKNVIKIFHDETFHDKDGMQVQKSLSNDERYSKIQDDFKKNVIENVNLANVFPYKTVEQINYSVKNHEEEEKRNSSVNSKNLEKERDVQKQNTAISNFKILLENFIKNPDLNWHTAKRILKGDHRWDISECLELEKREELYNNHIDSLICKSKEQFHQLLDEIPNITLKTSWLDIRKFVLKDQRCIAFSASERKCENEFKEYLKIKFMNAKTRVQKILIRKK